MLTVDTTQLIMERYFEACLRYWEKILGQNRDTDKECYSKAIDDIRSVEYDPFSPYPVEDNRLEPITVQKFIEYRETDLGGKHSGN